MEDYVEAFGSRIRGQHVGRFGDISTCGFFAAIPNLKLVKMTIP